MRRSKPRSLAEFLLYIAISLSCLWMMYATFVHYMGRHTDSLLERAKQQSASRPASAQPLAPSRAMSEEEIQRQREIAAAIQAKKKAEQKKLAAWDQYYQPPRSCIYPEDEKRASVCRAHEKRQRETFEMAWASQ